METLSAEAWTIIGTYLGTAIAVWLGLALMAMRITSRLDRRIEAVHDEAVADRRAMQASMDAFRQEMLRLAERQAHTEGLAHAD